MVGRTPDCGNLGRTSVGGILERTSAETHKIGKRLREVVGRTLVGGNLGRTSVGRILERTSADKDKIGKKT